ncbi:MAG TPA: alpha/beta hydrolase [Caulobacteraceae bacterium]|jgi:lysophospholipase
MAALLALGACGQGDRSAFVESRPPPGLAERFYPPEDWAWGELQLGDGPVQRYGVAGTPGVAGADILILPDYGESAETWFETARDLTRAGFTVWVLEGVGQGGSERLSGRRDLGELKSFAADVAAVQAMIDVVVHPKPNRPLVLLGEGAGAYVAARAVELGAQPAALVLSSPLCRRGLAPGALVALGLGSFRAPGGDAWRRGGPDDLARHRTHDAWRGAVTQSWQVANPDLRLGGPSLDWEAALNRLQAGAQADVARLTGPTLLIETDGRAGCLRPPVAELRTIPGSGPAFELEDDARRRPWLAAVEGFARAAAARARPPLPAHGP